MISKERVNITPEELFTIEDLKGLDKFIQDARLNLAQKCLVEDLYGEVFPVGLKKVQ